KRTGGDDDPPQDDPPPWESPPPPPARPPSPLSFVAMDTWDKTSAPSRLWFVEDHIPLRQVMLLSGSGGVGKSILLVQLLVASVLGRKWIGTMEPIQGPTIYLAAEEDQDELWRRLIPILKYYGATFADLIAGGFHMLAYAGESAVLGALDHRTGAI